MSDSSDSNSLEPRPEGLITDLVSDPSEQVGSPIEPIGSVGGWQIIVVKPRVDSFNQDSLIDEMRSLRLQGQKKIALDLRNNRFLSLPAIKACVDLAKQLADESGAFALVSCPEKTKRHFEIYGSLKHIRVVRSERDLDLPVRRAF